MADDGRGLGAGRCPRGSKATGSPANRRKSSEFFIGKNSIREREAAVFVIGHPRREDAELERGRGGGPCPAQRYPLIRRDGRSRERGCIPSASSSPSIYNVPFVRPLSKKSITRQHTRVPRSTSP